MFVCSVHATRKKLAAAAAILAALAAAVILCLGSCQGESRPAQESVSLDSPQAMQEWLAERGIEVSLDGMEQDSVTIPQPFDEIYTRYNQLQQEAGFDLSPYQGATVQRYTFSVENYPDHPEGVRAHLLLSDGVLIGGDICSAELDGFLTGLTMPS